MAFGDDNNNPLTTNFDEKLQSLIAPYQQMAQKLNTPYATMGNGGWLGANHPQVAKALDSAFLAAAMTPGPQGPEGVGGGISRAFQGLVGAQQYNRQRALQAAMLPYQMLQPRLQAEDTMSQIQQRGQMAQHYRDEGDFYRGRIAHYDSMDDIRQQQVDINQQRVDAYQEKIDKDPVGFLKTGSGGILGQLAVAQNPRQPNESDVAYAKRVADSYIGLANRAQAGAAGSRKTAETNVTTPLDQDKALVQNEEKNHLQGPASKILSPSEFAKLHETDPEFILHGEQVYNRYASQRQVEVQQNQHNFEQYRTSRQPGETYDAWHARVTGAVAGPGPVSNSGSNWTPQQ